MNCKEFERLLWDGPGELTASMNEHLKICSKCRDSYARYRQMFILAEQSEVDRSEAFWRDFNAAVWKKIDKSESPKTVSQTRLWQRPATNIRRLSISAGLAIVTVTILIILVTDLARKAPIPEPTTVDNYRTFDITLQSPPPKPQEFAEEQKTVNGDTNREPTLLKGKLDKKRVAFDNTSAVNSINNNEPRADSSAALGSLGNANENSLVGDGRKVNPVPPIVSNDTLPVMETAALSKKAGEETSPLSTIPQITTDTNNIINFQHFSILAEPRTDKKGDSGSVSIDAVFLTDDGLKDKQISVAQSISADEVVMNKPSRISLSGLATRQTSFSRPQVISLSKMPRPKHLSTPQYPSIAYSLGKEGEVWVKAFVNTSGKVEQAEIYQSTDSDYGFEEEALKAAYKNEFEPLEIDGRKTPVWVIYRVRFIKEK
jgi:TonB family protein